MAWRTNRGMQVLVDEIKEDNPGCVIGTIGDNRHATENPSSDHNPKLLNGAEVVNACDPMVSAKLTKGEIDAIVSEIIRKRDKRVKYIIWQRKIISGPNGIKPWVWRTYTGTSDPHTGHAHISVTDAADKNTDPWIGEKVVRKVEWIEFNTSMPILKLGDSDDDFGGYDRIKRIQRAAGFTGADVDGVWGPATSAKLGYGVMTEDRYRDLFGLGE